MRTLAMPKWLFFALFISYCINNVQAQQNKNLSLFDDGWKFFRGSALGAEKVAFEDKTWRPLDLPHDWSVEDQPYTNSPFSAGAVTQVNGGFTSAGTGWYRKHFRVPASDSGQRFVFQFDGVYMNADVWVNGKNLAKHPYGYTSFWFDATDRIIWGKDNVIAVRVRNEGENSRWYAGSGIYRHVWMSKLAPLHVAQWGVYITTPEASNTAASVAVKTSILNQQAAELSARLVTTIVDAQNNTIATETREFTLKAGAQQELANTIKVANPSLWSVESPYLYKLVSEVFVGDKLQDETVNSFGIRTIKADAVNGFQLNGKTVKLKGGCIHHDNGSLGAKAYDRAEERKIELLKQAGYNAVRSSHNPPSPALLDACDRLGMLVIDEAFDCWEDKKNVDDYHRYFKEWWQRDVESMVLRDRNHPSIVMWSTGNEIPNRDKPEVVAVAKKLADHIRSMDDTRLITCGVNGVGEDKDPFFETLDIAGYNYAVDKYVPDHQRLPKRVMMATESFPLQAFDYWMAVEDNPWVIGDFVWTAYDYIGEASIGWLGYPQSQSFYPWNLAYCGDIDVCGWKRPQSFYRDALWKKDQLSIMIKAPKPSFDTAVKKELWSNWEWQDVWAKWDWKGYENKPLKVEVYSSCEAVELWLNGKSLGRLNTNRNTKFMAAFTVPYKAGELKAVGYTNGKAVQTSILKTAGKPAAIKLSADRASLTSSGQDLSYITVELTDANGNRIADAEKLVKFSIAGDATIVGVGNANPRSVESYQQPQRTTWQGRCLAIVKAGKNAGKINLKATVAGLPAATIQLTVK